MSTFSMLTNVTKLLTVHLNIRLTSVRHARGIRHRNILSSKTALEETFVEDDNTFIEDELEDKFSEVSYSENRHVSSSKRTNKNSLEKERKEFLKKKIIASKEKKYYEGREPYLLTWAAMCQIQHLNREKPDEWTPEVLAQSFPVSKETIVKILRLKRLPYDEAEIARHDRRVYRNWQKLKVSAQIDKDGGPIDPDYSHLVNSNKLGQMMNAAGIASLPAPAPSLMFLTQIAIAERKQPRVERKFSSLLDMHEIVGISKSPPLKHDSAIINIEDSRMVPLLKGFSEKSTKQCGNDSVYDSGQDKNYLETGISAGDSLAKDSGGKGKNAGHRVSHFVVQKPDNERTGISHQMKSVNRLKFDKQLTQVNKKVNSDQHSFSDNSAAFTQTKDMHKRKLYEEISAVGEQNTDCVDFQVRELKIPADQKLKQKTKSLTRTVTEDSGFSGTQVYVKENEKKYHSELIRDSASERNIGKGASEELNDIERDVDADSSGLSGNLDDIDLLEESPRSKQKWSKHSLKNCE